MTEPNQKGPTKIKPIEIILGGGFYVALLIGIIFGLVRCVSGDPSVSSAQKKRYDECMAEKQKLGVGLIKADGICDYWKRADP